MGGQECSFGLFAKIFHFERSSGATSGISALLHDDAWRVSIALLHHIEAQAANNSKTPTSPTILTP
jgi:hypothetical protein